MNAITHVLVGWGLATAVPGLSREQKAWCVAAAIAPDVDGLGLVVELATRSTSAPVFWWTDYHHLLAHNVPFATGLAVTAAALTRRAASGGLVFAGVLLHLLCDLVGSRGPDGYPWPLHVLWPLSDQPALAVAWQWQLNAWPNVSLSLVLLAYVFRVAITSGSSPLELFSGRFNRRFVAALRQRFPAVAAELTARRSSRRGA